MAPGFGEAKNSQKNSSKPSSLLEAIDCEQIEKQLFEHFEDLTDPRGKQGVLHPFMSIVMIALLKRWSINLLNQETSFKRSTRQKARRASMDSTYLLKVINASIPL